MLCVRLTTLNLSGNELTEEAVPPLLECLRGHPTLQQLMLDDNELENDGAEAIADFFATEASVHAPSSHSIGCCLELWLSSGCAETHPWPLCCCVWPTLRAGLSWVCRRCRICAS